MIDPSVIPPTDEEVPGTRPPSPSPFSQLESLVRHHPFTAALATLGFGCAVSLVARELLAPPPSPKQRTIQLLEDIQSRLAEIAEPAYDRATGLAHEGVSTVKHRLDSVRSSKLGSRLGHLFS